MNGISGSPGRLLQTHWHRPEWRVSEFRRRASSRMQFWVQKCRKYSLKKKKKNLTVPFSRLCPRVCLRPPSLSPPPTLRLSRYVSSPWRSAYSALPRCIWRCARARVPHKLRYSDWISTFSNGQGAKLKVFIYVHNFFNLIYVIILTCIFTGGLVDTGDFVLKRDLFQTYNKQTTISCRQTHTHTHTKSNIKPK